MDIGTLNAPDGLDLADPSPSGGDERGGLRVLQRVVLPDARDIASLSLYIDPDTGGGGGASAQAGRTAPVGWIHPDDILGRSSVRVRAGERLSFGSYFNAFPASYWRRWTTVEAVILQVRTEGSGFVLLYCSNDVGSPRRLEIRQVHGSQHSVFEIPLTAFGDGGWCWFDLVAGGNGMELASARWCAASDVPAGKATLGITTFNRAEYCLDTIGAIEADPEVRKAVHELIVVDQGDRKVQDQAGYPDLARAMGGQLRVINQGNLGGSGGFARVMSETAQSGTSIYAILLDDDIVLEPEGILRAIAFADLCRIPTIVGGHMFDMYNKSVLNAFAEMVDPYRFLWGPGKGLGPHDFAVSGLRSSSILHRRWDADYNGWWMCLIPVRIIHEAGLPLPIFIKWDDAEYSLRARKLGFPTVSLPGAAVWHVSWADKDDAVDWQAYFHERNRLIAALLHSPYAKGGRVLRESLDTDFRHLFSMQYYPETIRLMALRDVLQGPAGLHAALKNTLPRLQALRADYSDAVLDHEPGALPSGHTGKGLSKPLGRRSGDAPRWGAWTLKAALKHTAQPVSRRMVAAVSHQDSKWWTLSRLDEAVVTNAEGTGAARYQRDPRQVRKMLAETAALKARLLAEWESLRAAYREALPGITSMEAWERTFRAD
ncbi:glycosyltransferase [Arthrobacter sp. zg-Y859]|uniref:Glycosyltransferase n=1 Tax=Arthrobacter jinronghuae TaxID=2964609 RepID=A0ABT1NQH0_9MICC|nr:glycosyltransferase [Arthrobacter jinronghuae]MCQ1949847.1 glycosyltransferase [Arthrobacter jinronghuae]UWX79997.1 glycosyltransferase [Arthrobacter jinronghuae]